MDATEAYDLSNKAGKEFSTRFNSLGQAGVVASSGFGEFVEAANLGARSTQDLAKSAKEIEEAQKGQKAGADGLVGTQVELRREQMNTRDSLQNLVKIGVDPTTRAMKGFAEFVEGITGVPAKVAPGALGTPGGKTTVGSTGPGVAGGAAMGALGGAATGAAIGSVVPVFGTGVGAAVGAIAGGFYGGLAGSKTTAVTGATSGLPASEQKILDFIAKYESGGDYNKMVGGANAPLSEMTVAEVLQFQAQRVAQGKGSAAGKYQIIQKTLSGLLAQGVVSPEDRFDAITQDKLGRALLNQSGYQDYKSGRISKDAFADRLAGVWAALPNASGRSVYEGQNGNRALTTRAEFLGAIEAKYGGVISAKPGGTMVNAAEAGMNEAFVPLPDGRSIPVTFKDAEKTFQTAVSKQIDELSTRPTTATAAAATGTMLPSDVIADSLKQQAQAMITQIAQMDELVSLMRTQNSTSSKILQVSQA